MNFVGSNIIFQHTKGCRPTSIKDNAGNVKPRNLSIIRFLEMKRIIFNSMATITYRWGTAIGSTQSWALQSYILGPSKISMLTPTIYNHFVLKIHSKHLYALAAWNWSTGEFSYLNSQVPTIIFTKKPRSKMFPS